VSRLAEQPTPEDVSEQLGALDIGLFVSTTASTLVGLGFAKLERRDFAQARLAIDTVQALVGRLEGDAKRNLEAAVAHLQVAYADAVSETTREPGSHPEPGSENPA
jgi:hypothetical protein